MRPEILAFAVALLIIAGEARAGEAPTGRDGPDAVPGDLSRDPRGQDGAAKAKPGAGLSGQPRPDLSERLPRGAEASGEWLDLIRRAKARKTGSGPLADAARSAEGSAELHELMRDARRRKAGLQAPSDP